MPLPAPVTLDVARFVAGCRRVVGLSRERDDHPRHRDAAGPAYDETAMRLALLLGLCWLGWNKALDAAEHPDPAIRAREREDLDWWVRTGAQVPGERDGLRWMSTRCTAGPSTDRVSQTRQVAEQWDLPDAVLGMDRVRPGQPRGRRGPVDGAVAAGQTIADVGRPFDGDVLGDEPIATTPRRGGRGRRRRGATAARGRHRAASYGEERLEEYVCQLAADHLVHGWDLAAAIGASRVLDPDAVGAVAAWFADREDAYRGAGAIGPRTGWYDDPQDDLIAGFGRDWAWGQS